MTTTSIHKPSFDECTLPTVDIIKSHGYLNVQIYKVQTSDGYILELHRIPKNREGKKHYRKYPVLIPHALLGSSADWVVGGITKSLPMQLADDGYDVWLANYRGNTYARSHKEYSNKEYKFWDFSMHELGVIDLPTMIDFILKQTKTKKLHYIGYSMSATIFFIMASEIPEYQKKIQSNILLAPVANIVHTTSTIKYVGLISKTLHVLYRIAYHGEFFSHTKGFSYSMMKLNEVIFLGNFLRRKVFNGVFGNDPYYFNESLFPVVVGHYPAGTSSKLIQHYSQSMLTDGFCQFDYGPKENLQNYGSKNPPSYNLNRVKIPTVIFRADNDALANPKDMDNLLLQLPNVVKIIKVNNMYFNHVDFLHGTVVTELINNPIKEILEQTDNQVDQYTSESCSDRPRVKIQ